MSLQAQIIWTKKRSTPEPFRIPGALFVQLSEIFLDITVFLTSFRFALAFRKSANKIS